MQENERQRSHRVANFTTFVFKTCVCLFFPNKSISFIEDKIWRFYVTSGNLPSCCAIVKGGGGQIWIQGVIFWSSDFCCFIVLQVVFTEAFRAKEYHSQTPPHVFKFKYNATHPYEREIGTQVLMDILLLAKCDVFLHAESSVAALASYFNPHMRSYFMDEKPAKVGLTL